MGISLVVTPNGGLQMKKFQSMLFAVVALALSLSGSASAQTRIVDDAPPRGEFRSYWPTPLTDTIVVAQAETSRWGEGVVVDDAPPRGVFRSYWPTPLTDYIVVAQASIPASSKAVPKLASSYRGDWKTPNAAGLVRTAAMHVEVLNQSGATATGIFSSYAHGTFIVSACMDRVNAPFTAEFSESDQVWKFVVGPVHPACNQPWKYAFSVAPDGVLKATRTDPGSGFVTTFTLAPAAGTMTAGVAP
ncbi:MAG: hypothetical protein ABI747_00070 [Candidatus Moraniibacteriota bacterium]